MRYRTQLPWIVAIFFCASAAYADQSSLIERIEGGYFGGPALKDCSINLSEGKRRCNCVRIKKLTSGKAHVQFDRHDSKEGYACVGEGIANVEGDSLVLCADSKSANACVTINLIEGGIEFHSAHGGQPFCGIGASVDGMKFMFADRTAKEPGCGP